MSFGGIISGMFSGASEQETQNAKEESQFGAQMRQETGTIFGENQAAQKDLNDMWDNVLKQGPYQYGFTAAEDQLLQNQIETAGATATANTINAAELRQQQMTGGASAGPTGGTAALEALAAQTQAQDTAQSVAEERLAGYQRGSQLATEATQVKQGELAEDNAASYSNAATSAAGAANSANQIVDTANANSLTAKLIGGAAQGAMMLGTAGAAGAMGISPQMMGAVGGMGRSAGGTSPSGPSGTSSVSVK